VERGDLHTREPGVDLPHLCNVVRPASELGSHLEWKKTALYAQDQNRDTRRRSRTAEVGAECREVGGLAWLKRATACGCVKVEARQGQSVIRHGRSAKGLHKARKRSWKSAKSRVLDEAALEQSRRRMTLARSLSRTRESRAIRDIHERTAHLDAAHHGAEGRIGVDIDGRLVFRDVFNEIGDVLRQDTAVDRALRERGMTKGVERVLREDGGGAEGVVRAPASFSARGGRRRAKQLTLGVERRVEGHDQRDGR
jgi:hypothetical protein